MWVSLSFFFSLTVSLTLSLSVCDTKTRTDTFKRARWEVMAGIKFGDQTRRAHGRSGQFRLKGMKQGGGGSVRGRLVETKVRLL